MKHITLTEEIVLLAIWRLKDNAYGVTIKEQVSEVTGKIWSIGALYVTLDQLVKKGFIQKQPGEPTPERGGRTKMFYLVTSQGKEALHKAKDLQNSLWEGLLEFN